MEVASERAGSEHEEWHEIGEDVAAFKTIAMLGLQPHSSLLYFIKHAVSTIICGWRGAVEGEGQVGVLVLLAGGAGLPECHCAGGGHSAVRLRGEGPFDAGFGGGVGLRLGLGLW